jgi:hypothetical protein
MARGRSVGPASQTNRARARLACANNTSASHRTLTTAQLSRGDLKNTRKIRYFARTLIELGRVDRNYKSDRHRYLRASANTTRIKLGQQFEEWPFPKPVNAPRKMA